MSDIAQLLSNAAQTNADFDLGKINKSYWEGKDQYAKDQLREAFKDGVPLTPDGQPDFAAMAKTLFQKGGLNEGVAASNLGIQRDQLKLGQDVAGKMGQMESGGSPIVSPPSSNRNASATVAPPLQRGGPGGSGPQGPQGDQPGSIVGLVSSAGIPDELAGPVIQQISAMTKTDPNAALNPEMSQRVQQVVQAAAQRMKAGQAPQPTGLAPQGQPPPGLSPQPQPPPQAAPPPDPQQNQGTFGAPSAIATRGAIPTGTDPEVQKQIATYTAIASNPAYPKSVQEAAMTRLKALQEQSAPTGPIKEYDLARRQGYKGTLQDFLAETEAKKTAATEEAKAGTVKYQTMVDAGVKAQQEIPQLEMLQKQMDDPNFFSGAGEKYILLYKRLKSAAGIDPDAAVPQEFLRKATAASVLASFGALKGLGPIRVAEMNLAKQAAAAPENSIPANKLLVEIQKRTYQRQADIAEMAQNYKEQNGTLDAGFDKQVTAYFKAHPMFTEGEINDFHKAINAPPKTTTASAQPPMDGAKKAPDGNWYVPDPNRAGKYLKVVQ